MMPNIELIQEALRQTGDDSAIRERVSLSGGSISQVLRVRSEHGAYLLKTGGRGLPRFFECEARGLGLLAEASAVRMPKVLAYHDAQREKSRPGDGETSFILMEWLDPPGHPDRARAGELLGTALAALHHSTAPAYGLDHDNYIGATPQPNAWNSSWLVFFRERRLRFQANLARRNGLLPTQRAGRLEQLLDRIDHWIDDGAVQPALLHGDLWGGNFIVAPGNLPVLIDPAAYYGDREADLAFTTLFGGFPEAFYRAYQAAWPLAPGWRQRRELYNLYHLLSHLNLFGESYGAQVDSILRRYVGR
jgi:fructosamine-3-kinase